MTEGCGWEKTSWAEGRAGLEPDVFTFRGRTARYFQGEGASDYKSDFVHKMLRRLSSLLFFFKIIISLLYLFIYK